MTELKLPRLIYRGLLADDGRINAFLQSRCAVEWLLACEMLDTEILYKSRVHGMGHIERVMLLGGLIARAERLSLRDTRLLLFACSYHDIGRTDDRKDDLHGRRSAQMISSRGLVDIPGDFSSEEIAMLKTAITTHSVSDSLFEQNAALFGVKAEDLPRCREICFCLKDADNLDRVRLGDLDVRHLRHDSSVAMEDTAHYIFSSYMAY